MYEVKLSRTFLVTVSGISAETVEEAQELAFEYFEEGKVTFDDIVDRVVSVSNVKEGDSNE